MTENGRRSASTPEEINWLPIGDHIRVALALLCHAQQCAEDAHAVPWDFAVEIGKLSAAGLTITDLRWLVIKGLVEHGAETSIYGDAHRSFTRSEGLNFLPTTCVVLTPRGAEFASCILQGAGIKAGGGTIEEKRTAVPASEIPYVISAFHPQAALKPHWNPVRRVLSLGDRIVKQFRVPAGNQELILAAFEEEGWPECLYDPLPGTGAIDSQTRLRDAISRLNRKQTNRLLRFRGNGTGTGVAWECRPSTPTDNGSTTDRHLCLGLDRAQSG